MKRATAVMILALCSIACTPEQREAADRQAEALGNTFEAAEARRTAASPVMQDAAAAKMVLERYFALLSEGNVAEAYALRTAGTAGQSEKMLAADRAKYRAYEAEVLSPGRIEGAAGSLYVEIPVRVDARPKGGGEERLAGKAVMRRSNDVPGATPEQRAWRLYRLELAPVR